VIIAVIKEVTVQNEKIYIELKDLFFRN